MKNAMTELELAEQAIAERRRQYPQFLDDFACLDQTQLRACDQLNHDGFVVMDGFVDRAEVKTLNQRFESFAACGENLQLPRDIASRKPGQADWEVSRISQEELSNGVDPIRHRTHMIQAKDPFLHFPELLHIALDERILDIVGAYLGCLPSMGFAKITKSLANDIDAFDTQMFHIDGNAAKMVKAFLLFNDVEEGGGPHLVVKNSHKDRFEGCFDKLRWNTVEMIEKFGEDRLFRHFGKAGDLVIEDTSAFHCGEKPTLKDRTLVIFNYVPHEEYGGGGDRLKAPKSELAKLSEKQIAAADELVFI